ncbi:unnamed protein product [Rotaria socialis]|uniref:Uncharacterized protein n=1 Tax=Rotaria socialis TaxID=392032 RepID=A0A821UH16_9BILA|nr:unnamed protein product [Rotaria socialis]
MRLALSYLSCGLSGWQLAIGKQILSGSRPVWESSPKVKNLVSTLRHTWLGTVPIVFILILNFNSFIYFTMAENTNFDNDSDSGDNVFETLGFDNGDEVSSSGPDPIDIEKATIAEIIRGWEEASLEFKQQIKKFIEHDNIDLGALSSQDLISMAVAARLEIEHKRKQAGEKKSQSSGTNGSNSTNAKTDQTGNNQSGDPLPTSPASPASQGPISPGQASGNKGAQSPSSKKSKSPKKSTDSVRNNDLGNNASHQQNKPKKNPYATGAGNQMYKMAGRMHRMHLNIYGNNNHAYNNSFHFSGGNGPRPTGSHCNQNNAFQNNYNSNQNKSFQNNSHAYHNKNNNNHCKNNNSQNNSGQNNSGFFSSYLNNTQNNRVKNPQQNAHPRSNQGHGNHGNQGNQQQGYGSHTYGSQGPILSPGSLETNKKYEEIIYYCDNSDNFDEFYNFVISSNSYTGRVIKPPTVVRNKKLDYQMEFNGHSIHSFVKFMFRYHNFAVEQLEADDFSWKKDLTNKLKGSIIEKACYLDEDCCYPKFLRNIFYYMTSKGIGLKENLMYKYNNLSKYINETAFEYCNRIRAAFRNAYPGVEHQFDDGLRTRCLNSLDHDTRIGVEAELRRLRVPGDHCDNEQLLQIIDNVEEMNRVNYGRVDVNAGFYSDRQTNNSRKNDNYRQTDELNRSFKQTSSDNSRTRRRTSSVREENKNLYDLEELLNPTFSRQGSCGHYLGHFT